MTNLKYQTYYIVRDKRIIKIFWQLTNELSKYFDNWQTNCISTRPTTRYVTNELSKYFDNWQTNCQNILTIDKRIVKRFDISFINTSLKYQTYYTWLYKRNTFIITVPYRYHTYIQYGVHSMGGVSTNIATRGFIYEHP